MIDQVTESLEAFLKQPGLPTPLADAEVRFDRPTDPYSIDKTTLNVFLYEVCENIELRSNEPVVRRVGGGVVLEPPPYRATCLYLITAWPDGGTDLPKQEHRLLSQVLQLFTRTPTLPPAFLTPALQAQEPPLPTLLVRPDGVRNPAEFWAAIGNRIRASLLLSVTASLPSFAPTTFPAVISSELRLSGLGSSAPLEAPFFRIGGTVLDGGNVPVANASVRLVERSRSTLTDERGMFSLSAIPAGAFTLRITAGSVTKTSAVTVPAPALDEYDVQLP